MCSKATVMVHSCDSYSDVWDPFFALLNQYWSDCPYNIVIQTESRDYDGSKWNNLNVRTLSLFSANKTVSYGKRVREHCKHIDSEYVITLMDDFFIRSKVDTDSIKRIIEYMDNHPKVGCVCLVHHNDPYNIRYKYQEEGLEGYSKRPRYCHFAHDMQASIWRRKAYIESWKDYESPWLWESSISNVRSIDDGWEYYDKDCYTPFPIDYIDYKKDEWSGIKKGKWVKDTVYDLFARHGIEVDYSVRGFYNPEVDVPSSRTIKSTLKEIRCYGAKRRMQATLFLIKRLIGTKCKNIKAEETYIDYLRHKHYEKT